MRKGHGSTKVPNVKLRPAQKAKVVSQTPTATVWTEDGDPAEYTYDVKKPLAGLVLSASGIRDKSSVLKKAAQLGARTMTDLTDQVTHLICDAPGSAKYNYCVGHFIPIVKSSWILELFSKWVEGEEVDLNSSLVEHRLPAFTSTHLCITGIDDLEQRALIQSVLTKNGGAYVKSVEGNANITHLLCGADRGEDADERGWTAKMQQAERLNAKRRDKIVLVWDTWFMDCAHFGGLLNAEDYLVTKPRPKSKVPAEETKDQPSTDGALSAPRGEIPPSLPTNALTSIGDADEVAVVKRIPAATARLWHGLVKPRGFDMKSGKLVRSPTRSSNTSKLATGSEMRAQHVATLASPTDSRIAAFRRTKSFAPHEMPPVASSSKAPSVPKDVPTQSTIFAATNTLSRSTAPNTLTSSFLVSAKQCVIPEGERDLFVGRKFLALGEASSPRLEEEVRLRGGTTAFGKEDADYIVVRIVSGSKLCWDESEERIRAKYRTECWLEQCIFKERICEPDDHVTFTPLRVLGPIPGADKLSAHLSGLDAFERTSSMRLLKAVGISCTEHFSRRNTHLLCPSGTGAKVEKAHEWGIPVVNMQWLHAIASTGELQDADGYLVPSQGSVALDADEKMVDITNSDAAAEPSASIAQEQRLNTGLETSIQNNTPMTPRAAEKRRVQDSSRADDPPLAPGSTFGEPVSGLLRSSPQRVSSRRPMKSNSLPVLQDEVTANAPQQRRSKSDKAVFNGKSATAPQKHEIDTRLDNRVPSSNSPSPLKVPRETRTASPALMRDNANLLKDAITSLLGKRETQDEAGTEIAKPARGAKRPRPQTRRGAESISPAPRDFSSTPFNPDDFPASQLPPCSQLPPPMNSPTIHEDGKGIRVTYEDPVQREGQRRLKELLTGKVEPRKELVDAADAEMAEGSGANSTPVSEAVQTTARPTRGRKGKGKGRAAGF